MSRWSLLLAVFGVLTTAAIAQSVESTASTTRELTKPEAELVQLCQEMKAAFTDFYARDAELDDAESAKFRAEHDPTAKYVARFTEFERAHHGSHAGLMAARQLVRGGGAPGTPQYLGRRHALTVLRDYADAPVLPEIIRYLASGFVEPEAEAFLRQLMDAPGASDQNRAFAKYTFARWALYMRDVRESFERRLKELDDGAMPTSPKEKEHHLERLSSMPPSQKIAGLEREAVEILESLSASSLDVRQPGVAGVDKNQWYVIDIDPEKTKSMPLLKDLAAGELFKDRHLRVGRPAAEMKLQLVSGKEWSLAEQRDKVVVIQFSFKGCGPCEAMYPDLRALTEEYGEKLVILSVMADEKREDTTAAVESGKLTWNVYWDGYKGPMATKWAVTGYPTVYIVGPDGRMAAKDLRDEPLRTKIAELMR